MYKKCYTDLKQLQTFEERFEYLKIGGAVGRDTFGFDRYLNQALYRSKEWKRVRDIVITRDMGCDLGCNDREIYDKVIIHHMNPITQEDIVNHNPEIFDPEYLITTCHDTHNAIHYGDYNLVKKEYVERTAGDTKLW